MQGGHQGAQKSMTTPGVVTMIS